MTHTIKEKMLVVNGRHTDKETEMFPVSLAVCVSNEAAMQKAVLEKQMAVYGTQKLICEEMHLSLRLVLLMGICLGTLP